MVEYVGVSDLIERWVYSNRGVHKLVKTVAFPAPVFVVNRGRVKVWELSQIEAYEHGRPELLDDIAKVQKQRGYFHARKKGRASQNEEQAQP